MFLSFFRDINDFILILTDYNNATDISIHIMLFVSLHTCRRLLYYYIYRVVQQTDLFNFHFNLVYSRIFIALIALCIILGERPQTVKTKTIYLREFRLTYSFWFSCYFSRYCLPRPSLNVNDAHIDGFSHPIHFPCLSYPKPPTINPFHLSVVGLIPGFYQ